MDEFKPYFGFISALIGFVLAQVFNYIQMKFEHKQMMKSINGIGSKVKELADAQSRGNERIAKIEGYIEGFNNKV